MHAGVSRTGRLTRGIVQRRGRTAPDDFDKVWGRSHGDDEGIGGEAAVLRNEHIQEGKCGPRLRRKAAGFALSKMALETCFSELQVLVSFEKQETKPCWLDMPEYRHKNKT